MAWRRLAGRLGVTLAVAFSSAAAVADDIRLLTGPQQTSQHRLASELARRITPAAGMPVTVTATAGPGDILQRLRDDTRSSGLNLAVLQADIGQLYLNVALGGNREAASWLAPLRVVAPLYGEELHFIVRSDSAFETLQDIRNARINVGPVAGGTAMSVATLYRLLFDAPLPPGNLSRLDHEVALTRLLTDRSIDVVALLADQPAPLLANMKPEARRYVRLLKFDREHPSAAVASMVYGISALRATSYPRLLDQDVPTLAVRLYLVAHGKPEGLQAQRLRRIAAAVCTEVPRLKATGHQKWQEVAAGLPALAPGWHYSDVSTPDLARCLRLTENEIPDVCLPDERFLGLCGVTVIAAPVPAAVASPQ